MENWMFKATRLLLSNNVDDYLKINKMLVESLDPELENKIYKMTPEESLADLSKLTNTKSTEVQPNKKVRSVEIINSSGTSITKLPKRPITVKDSTEEVDKKKVQLLNVDIFSPVGSDAKRRRTISNSSSVNKEKLQEQLNLGSLVTAASSTAAEAAMMMSQEFSDLQCTACGSMTVAADNMLLECGGCRGLYHQKCHRPPVTQTEALQATWTCSRCRSEGESKSSSFTGSGSGPIDLTVSSHSGGSSI